MLLFILLLIVFFSLIAFSFSKRNDNENYSPLTGQHIPPSPLVRKDKDNEFMPK